MVLILLFIVLWFLIIVGMSFRVPPWAIPYRMLVVIVLTPVNVDQRVPGLLVFTHNTHHVNSVANIRCLGLCAVALQ